MPRQIKFRVWNTYQKKFYAQDKVAFSGDGSLLFFDWHEGKEMSWERDCWNSQDGGLFVVQRFTGLFDSVGREIYEGDIVTYQQPYRASRLTPQATTDSYRTIIAEVLYNEESFEYEIEHYSIGSSMIKSRKDLVVIGNIYENSELLVD